MKKRLINSAGVAVMIALVTLVVWQGSFDFGNYGPSSPQQTYLFWAVSTLVFLLTVTLGFMLFRTAFKLYMERQENREGSRIRTKLIAGALTLSFVPVIFLVIFDIHVLNRNLDKWFTRPAENIKINLAEIGTALEQEIRARIAAQAEQIASMPEIQAYAETGIRPQKVLQSICKQKALDEVLLEAASGASLPVCRINPDELARRAPLVEARAPVQAAGIFVANLLVRDRIPVDIAREQNEIRREIADYNQLHANKKEFRYFYRALLVLIVLFLLFFATWLAGVFARRLSLPITGLLEAAREIRSGNLSHRVHVNAIDELATLVRTFNEMTQALETNSRELERRRRFTETILDSIPTGVLSMSGDGRIQSYNPALKRILPEERVARATTLDDLFSRDDAAEVRYLMKRARRLGVASRQLDYKTGQQTLQLSLTVSALEERATAGFVMVVEDTSELLRAQKAMAWHEVARRVAHEIKNPLTPIALSAGRVARQLAKYPVAPEFERIVQECTATISREVETVKTLVNEFSQFARFPAARPEIADLNVVVQGGLSAFEDRLDGIRIHTVLTPDLPPVNIDREQFKRVVVNLVDNAAEAMQDSLVKELLITTQAVTTDSIELVVADTGVGISPEDKEKMFLPYFSTKGRGTGLGLAIVSHIISEHGGHIRVEDNSPCGARFIIEIPTTGDPERRLVETLTAGSQEQP
ncbi:MAG: HAMP domain-containing protein [Bryobacteraceae bacterium]|nr:ATP-binding protein [Bryobacterales bacterium]NUN02924.1 HAMP domain-containing protein [Bryobacteraceae bacterium]